MKNYTTGQVAELFGVADATIADWIDKGYAAAHKTPGGHRRMLPEGVIALARKLGREDVAQQVLAAMAKRQQRSD